MFSKSLSLVENVRPIRVRGLETDYSKSTMKVTLYFSVVIGCWRLLFTFPVASVAVSQEETITLHGRLAFPNKMPYNTTTKISVNHGQYITYSRSDGNFTLYDLPPGIYLIDVLSVNHHFSQVKCQYKPQVAPTGAETAMTLEPPKPVVSCLEYLYPGAPKRVLDEFLVIYALAEIQYFEERKGFSVMSLFQNPMLLMMGVMVVMMYMMPKLMEDMNPEERAQMKKQMNMQQDPMKMLGELFSGGGGGSELESKKKSKKQK
jgi:ER membrane protein complex subunit 7